MPSKKKVQKGQGLKKDCEKFGYKFKKVLGEGGFGAVYVSCKRESSTPRSSAPSTPRSLRSAECLYVAKLQVLRDEYGDEVEGFSREFEVYNKLGWDNGSVPKLYHMYECETKGVPYGVMIMEMMDGDLGKYFEDYQVDTDALIRVLKSVQKLLKEFEKYEIMHCDMKPANILFRIKDNKVITKITDFGWAFVESESQDYSYVNFYKLWNHPNKFYKDFDITCLIFHICYHYDYDILEVFQKLGKTGKHIYNHIEGFFGEYMVLSKISTDYYNILKNYYK